MGTRAKQLERDKLRGLADAARPGQTGLSLSHGACSDRHWPVPEAASGQRAPGPGQTSAELRGEWGQDSCRGHFLSSVSHLLPFLCVHMPKSMFS